MFRIGESKKPSVGQMKRMHANLIERRKEYCAVRIEASGQFEPKVEFMIYTETMLWKSFGTWPEALRYYRQLMEMRWPK